MSNLINMDQIIFYHEDAIKDTQYNNTFFYLGFKKKGSAKMKPVSFGIDRILSNDYLHNFEFKSDYDYYISPNVFKSRNGKSSENLFSIQIITIDVDCHDDNIKSYTIKRDIEILEYQAKKFHFPVSATIRSGRGVQLQFRIEKVSYKMRAYVERIVVKLMEEVQNIIDAYNLCLKVDDASRNLAGYFRAGNSYNTKTDGEQAIFTIHSREKYHFHNMSEYYHIFKKQEDFKKQYNEVNLKNQNLRCLSENNRIKSVEVLNNQIRDLHTKRLKIITENIKNLEFSGILKGFRDKHLFLACVSYYFLDKDTCLTNLKKLNYSLSLPLNNAEVENIYNYISSKNGLQFKNETFFRWLGFNQNQQDKYNVYKISRERSKERTQKRLDRNKQILIEYNGKNTKELSEKYNLTQRQIRNIIKGKHRQLEEEKYQKIMEYVAQGISKKEIAKLIGKCLATVYNIINRYKNNSISTTSQNNLENKNSKKRNTCTEYVVPPFDGCSSVVLCNDHISDNISNDTILNEYSFGYLLEEQLFTLFNLDEHSYDYLDKYDLAILKTLYAYTLYRYNGMSLSVDLSVDKLYYLCLPEWTEYKPYFERELGKYKDYISTAYNTLVFPDDYYYSRYNEWGDRFAYSALKRIRQSLRKFVYLGFVNANKSRLFGKYEYFSLSLNILNFGVSNQRYAELKKKGLSFAHFVCDNYIHMHLDNDLGHNMMNIRFKSNDNIMNNDVFKELTDILYGKNFITWSSLSNKLKIFATRFENMLDGYSILKVRNKAIIQKLSSLDIQGFNVGSKVIVKSEIKDSLKLF